MAEADLDAPGDLVPDHLFGIQTDVLRVPVARTLVCESLDMFSPLEGGITISNLKTVLSGGGLTPHRATGWVRSASSER